MPLKWYQSQKLFSIWAHSQKNEPHYCASSFPHKVISWETRIWLIFWEWYQIRSIFWDYTSFTEWGVPIHFLKTYPISQWGVHFANIIRTLICFRWNVMVHKYLRRVIFAIYFVKKLKNKHQIVAKFWYIQDYILANSTIMPRCYMTELKVLQ